MKFLTVRLSNVHDVLVNYAYRDGLYTRFSFTHDGREVKRARLSEKPEPADGTLLSVVLGDDEDWSRAWLFYLCHRFGSQVYPLFCAQRLLKALCPGH